MTGPRGLVELPEEDVALPNRGPKERPYDPEPGRDKLRGRLAIFLVGLLAAVIAAGWASLWWTLASEPDIKDLLGVILPPVVALVGSAVGFYFGGKPATK